MPLRLALVLMTVLGAAGALVLGTMETDAASAYWHARPGLETVGPAALGTSLLLLLAGTVGLVVARVRHRRTPAVDSPRRSVARTAWAGWVLVGAGAAFGVVLAAELLGLLLIEADGGCGDTSSWCGFGTAVLATAAGAAVAVLSSVGGALLGWSRVATPTASSPGPRSGGASTLADVPVRVLRRARERPGSTDVPVRG